MARIRWTPKNPDYALTLPLGVLCALLVAGLLLESVVFRRSGTEKPSPTAASATPQPAESADAETAFVLPSVEEYADFVDRPLFVEGRKPPPEEEQKQATEAQDTQPLSLKLMGVLFHPNGEMAILAEQSGKHRRIRKGGTISGWRLVDLKTDRVTVQRGDERRDLPLLKPRPKTAQLGTAGQPPQGPNPGGQPARRGAHPPPEPVDPEVEDMEEPAEDAGDESLGDTGDEMPESEE
jgi:hypothetical protein